MHETEGDVVVGAASDPISIQTTDLVFGTRTVTGSLTGTSIETRTTSPSASPAAFAR